MKTNERKSVYDTLSTLLNIYEFLRVYVWRRIVLYYTLLCEYTLDISVKCDVYFS